jgi:hypothetical protein
MADARTERPDPALPTGLLLAPAGWLLAQLLAWWLLPADCAGRPWVAPAIALVGALAAAAGGLLCHRSLGRHAPGAAAGRGHAFLAAVGAAGSLLFLLVILWQAAANLAYTGCEH